jgi:hypothetical protein
MFMKLLKEDNEVRDVSDVLTDVLNFRRTVPLFCDTSVACVSKLKLRLNAELFVGQLLCTL